MGKRASATEPKPKAAKAAKRAAKAAAAGSSPPEALALTLPLQQQSSVNSSQALVDTGGSKLTWMQDKCPCLTASRCKGRHGYWWHQGQRFLKPRNFFLLQGVRPGAYGCTDVSQGIEASVLGNMLGNAMSAGVVRVLVHCIFQARGIL